MYYGSIFAHLFVDNKNLPHAGDADSLRQSLERLADTDLLAIVRDADVTRVLAAHALLERNLDFDELFILAMDVPAIRNDFWKAVKTRATHKELLRIMENFPDLQERAGRYLLAMQPSSETLREMKTSLLRDEMGLVRAQVNDLLQ